MAKSKKVAIKKAKNLQTTKKRKRKCIMDGYFKQYVGMVADINPYVQEIVEREAKKNNTQKSNI